MNAIISGAGKGIGKAISQKLFEMGYNLILISRSMHNLEQTKSEINASNPDSIVRIDIFPADFSEENWIEGFQKKYKNHPINLIINNVGSYYEDTASGIDLKKFDRLLQTNFSSAVALTKFFHPEMQKMGKGHILNICSVAAVEVKMDAVSYSISKSALKIWGKALREELKNDNVKVTNVFPGSVATSSWVGSSADRTKMIQVEDIANAVEYALKLSKNANCDEIHLSPMVNL